MRPLDQWGKPENPYFKSYSNREMLEDFAKWAWEQITRMREPGLIGLVCSGASGVTYAAAMCIFCPDGYEPQIISIHENEDKMADRQRDYRNSSRNFFIDDDICSGDTMNDANQSCNFNNALIIKNNYYYEDGEEEIFAPDEIHGVNIISFKE